MVVDAAGRHDEYSDTWHDCQLRRRVGRYPEPLYSVTGGHRLTEVFGCGCPAAPGARCRPARHRGMLAPDDFGLPTTARRRTPGLRREEVAALSGVGTSWYAWLEQGRVTASAQVLGAISWALRLDEHAYRHLMGLAGHQVSRSGQPAAQLGDRHCSPPAGSAAPAGPYAGRGAFADACQTNMLRGVSGLSRHSRAGARCGIDSDCRTGGSVAGVRTYGAGGYLTSRRTASDVCSVPRASCSSRSSTSGRNAGPRLRRPDSFPSRSPRSRPPCGRTARTW